MKFNAELLKYVSFVLLGVTMIVFGIVTFIATGQLGSAIPQSIPRVAVDAPELLPSIQSVQAVLPLFSVFAVLALITGIVILIPSVLDLKEYKKKQRSQWTYYSQS